MKRQIRTNTRIINGIFWTLTERISSQAVTFIVSIILARLLSPDEYAVTAIVTVFITLANVFITSGFGNALIQKKDVDRLDFSTTLYFSLGLAGVLYVILYVCAPYIAAFYDIPMLKDIIRVLSLQLFFSSFNIVQQAYVSKMLDFKRFFYSTLSGTIVSAFVGIAMAYYGYGVWALVTQQLSNIIVNTIVLFFTCGWRPSLEFSFIRMKSLLSYGWKLLIPDLVGTVYDQARSLVLSKVYTPANLSYYNQGEKFPALFMNNIEISIHKVLLPIIALEQDDKRKVLLYTRKSLQIVTAIIWPILLGLVVVSETLVKLLLTEKWLPSVPYMQLVSLTYLTRPIIETHTRTLKAIGRSDVFAKIMIPRYSIAFLLLLISISTSCTPIQFMSTWTITMLVMTVLCAIASKKTIGYYYKDQIVDLFRVTLPCIAMSLSTVLMNPLFPIDGALLLSFQIMTGIVVYVVATFIFNKSVILLVFELFNHVIHYKDRK